MDAAQIHRALQALSDELGRRETRGEICLLGGTTMVLAFQARQSTKDVDAIFHPAQIVRESAHAVARELDLPDDWLNDAAKGFISTRHDVQAYNLPQFDNLRVVAPVPEYLFAMKCLASRIGSPGEADDQADIRFLIKQLGLSSAGRALEIVARYYSPEKIPIRAKYLLEEVFAEKK